MVGMCKKNIETKRLILRELTMEDLQGLHAILSDPEWMQHYPAPFSLEKTTGWISWNIENYAMYGFGLWAVMLKGTDAPLTLIGDCGITMQKIDGSMEPEIGYHIHKEFACNGYATEAARACRNYAFDTLQLPAIYSYMNENNLASQKVAQKNGMRLVKKIEETHQATVIYRITKEEHERLHTDI